MKKTAMTLLAAGMMFALALPGVASAEVKPPPPPKPTGCQDIVDLLPAPKNAGKVTLCHFTGSVDSNPFIINEVSESGAASHLLNPDHHGDCGRYGSATSQPNALICVQ